MITVQNEASVAKTAERINHHFRKFCTGSKVFPVPPHIVLQVGGTFDAPGMSSVRLGVCGGLTANDRAVRTFQNRFFIRQEFADTFQFLGLHSTSAIIGSPGTGKSVCVLRYAFYQDNPNAPSRFLLVRGTAGKVFFLWYRRRNGQYEVFETDCSCDHAYEMIGYLLEQSVSPHPILAVNLLIIDGFDEHFHKGIHGMMTNAAYDNIRLIVCCSVPSLRNDSETQSARPMVMTRMNVWSKTDYAAAIRTLCFPSIDVPLLRGHTVAEVINNIVNERFYYSGGNCRWFCALGVHYEKFIVNEIQQALAYCPLLNSIVCVSSTNNYFNGVNSLFVTDNNSCLVFSSEYVAKHISARVSLHFIKEARNVFSHNPIVQEWITKLEVIKRMTTDAQFNVLDVNNAIIQTWTKTVGTCQFYDSDEAMTAPVTVGRFYFPHKWYQDLFDGLFMVSRHEAHFFNVTDANTHSFKHKHLLPFITGMRVHRIRFYFICRNHNVTQFTLPSGGSWGTSLLAIKRRLNSVRRAKVVLGEIAATDNEFPFVFDVVVGKFV